MNSFITIAGVVLIGLMLLVLVQFRQGPTVIDARLVAVFCDRAPSQSCCCFRASFSMAEMFVDIALGYGLLNFIVSIAASATTNTVDASSRKGNRPDGYRLYSLHRGGAGFFLGTSIRLLIPDFYRIRRR